MKWNSLYFIGIILLIIYVMMNSGCETNQERQKERWARVEELMICKLSPRFNNECLCVVQYYKGAGVTFASDAVCDGDEEGAIP